MSDIALGIIPPEYNKFQTQITLTRAPDWNTRDAPHFTNTRDIMPVFRLMRGADREWLLIICLDAQLHLVGLFEMAIGDQTSSMYSILELARIITSTGAINIIVAHNHPSGTPDPSDADKRSYDRTIKLVEVLGVGLLDWLIVGVDKIYTMKGNAYIDFPRDMSATPRITKPVNKEVKPETIVLPVIQKRPERERQLVPAGGQRRLFDHIRLALLRDLYDTIISKLEHPNMSPDQVREALSWRPLRELVAWAVGTGKPVQLFKVGMVEGTYQLTFRELTPTLYGHVALHVKDVPRIKRVYSPLNEAVFEIIVPGPEKIELEFVPQEVKRAPRFQPGAQAVLFGGSK